MAIQVRFKELGVVSPVRCCRNPVRGGKGSLDLHKKTTGNPREHGQWSAWRR